MAERITACRRCGRADPSRPRGLCWVCYADSAARELFPPVSAAGRRGVGRPSRPPPLPAAPTLAPPGSAAKLAVLADRAARDERLFHPLDATFAGPPRQGDAQEPSRSHNREGHHAA